MGKTPGPLDAVAYVHVNLFGDGSMSISGNIGDKKLSLDMLRHALDTLKTSRQYAEKGGVMVPYQDVEVEPVIRLTSYGDVMPDLRPVIDMPNL